MIGNYSVTIIKCLIAILVAILEGNAVVYVFNNIPVRWLADYNQEPCDELLNCDKQRVPSNPWKFIFTMLFVAINIKLLVDGTQWAINSTVVLWLLIEIAIGDKKYKIIPDQFLILLSVSAIGFLPFNTNWYDGLMGAIIGLILIFICQLSGRIFSRKDIFGGGDLKLFAAIGLIIGPIGIIFVFCLSIVLSALVSLVLMIVRKVSLRDTIAFAPFVATATGVYLLFFSYLGEGFFI